MDSDSIPVPESNGSDTMTNDSDSFKTSVSETKVLKDISNTEIEMDNPKNIISNANYNGSISSSLLSTGSTSLLSRQLVTKSSYKACMDSIDEAILSQNSVLSDSGTKYIQAPINSEFSNDERFTKLLRKKLSKTDSKISQKPKVTSAYDCSPSASEYSTEDEHTSESKLSKSRENQSSMRDIIMTNFYKNLNNSESGSYNESKKDSLDDRKSSNKIKSDSNISRKNNKDGNDSSPALSLGESLSGCFANKEASKNKKHKQKDDSSSIDNDWILNAGLMNQNELRQISHSPSLALKTKGDAHSDRTQLRSFKDKYVDSSENSKRNSIISLNNNSHPSRKLTLVDSNSVLLSTGTSLASDLFSTSYRARQLYFPGGNQSPGIFDAATNYLSSHGEKSLLDKWDSTNTFFGNDENQDNELDTKYRGSLDQANSRNTANSSFIERYFSVFKRKSTSTSLKSESPKGKSIMYRPDSLKDLNSVDDITRTGLYEEPESDMGIEDPIRLHRHENENSMTNDFDDDSIFNNNCHERSNTSSTVKGDNNSTEDYVYEFDINQSPISDEKLMYQSKLKKKQMANYYYDNDDDDIEEACRCISPLYNNSDNLINSETRPLLEKEIEYPVHIPTSSFIQSVFNSANVLIGMGVLSLAYIFMTGGLVVGCIILCVFTLITIYTAKVLARCLDIDPKMMTYSDIGERAFGKFGEMFILVVFITELIGAAVAFYVLVGDTLQIICPGIALWKLKFIAFLIMTPTALLRDLSLLAYTSFLGIGSILLLMVTLLLDGLMAPHVWPGSLLAINSDDLRMTPEYLMSLPVTICLVLASFAGHAVFPNIYRDMKQPKQYDKMLVASYTITFLFYLGMGLTGYLMFGSLCKDEITKNINEPNYFNSLKPHQQLLTRVALWLIAINPISKFSLTLQPVFSYVEVKLLRNWLHIIPWYLIRIAISAFIMGIAIVFPGFDRVMALMGSMCSFTVSVSFPCACSLKLFGPKLPLRTRILEMFLLVNGTILAVIGVIWSFLPEEILKSF